MSWFIDDKRTYAQKTFGNILKCGPLPKHIGIIMDGNRRYARNKNIKKIDGHISGFEKLVEALNWCFSMEVKEVTVYAFSIENFKRSEEEVNGLFDLAREKFERLLNEKDKIDELKVCIRIFGDLSMLPTDLQQTIAKVMEMTKENKNLFLNVCIAYTSREEITMSMREICKGIDEAKLQISDIDENLIDKCLFTGNSYSVDILVRTSGEVRLSDFLLWQCNVSSLSFVKKMWPEFSIWNFYMGIIQFQLNYEYIQKMKGQFRIKSQLDSDDLFNVDDGRQETKSNSQDEFKKSQADRREHFLNGLHKSRSDKLQTLAAS